MVDETMGGGQGFPTKISLTWVSYAEKKFWKLEDSITLLKARDRMQALIDTGYIFKDYMDSVLKRTTYKRIAIGMAPGGIVAVWLVGIERCTQVATMQARPAQVDFRRLLPVAGAYASEQAFFDREYITSLPDTTRPATQPLEKLCPAVQLAVQDTVLQGRRQRKRF